MGHHWEFIAADPYPYSGLMDGKELTRRACESDGLVVSSDGTLTATLPACSVTTLVSDTH